ncbi:MAG: DUF6916 family protein [Stellaceae bacterium]
MHTIEEVTADDFAAYLGRPFRPVGSDLDLILASVDRRERIGWEATFRKPVALILRGPRHPVLPEGHHRLTIDGGATLILYVIPIFTVARDHQDYQIVFN